MIPPTGIKCIVLEQHILRIVFLDFSLGKFYSLPSASYSIVSKLYGEEICEETGDVAKISTTLALPMFYAITAVAMIGVLCPQTS